MFSLMLDPKFKTLGLRSFVLCSHLLVVNKERPSLENMIKNLCFSCFLSVTIICILWLNMKGVLLIKGLKRTIVWIFKKMIANTIEPSMKLINRELLIFKRYQVDVKDIKCPLQQWEKHENMFPIVGLCAKQVLRLLESQIDIKKIIFSLIGILFNFRRYHLQSKNLDKLIFVNKNWPYDILRQVIKPLLAWKIQLRLYKFRGRVRKVVRSF